MICPHCNINSDMKRIETRNMSDGRIYSRCECRICGKRYNTIETYVPDDQEPALHMFRRYPAKVLYREKHEPKPVAFIKRR